MEMEMEMLLMKFESYLCDEEKSKSTINKYLHDVREMLDFTGMYKQRVADTVPGASQPSMQGPDRERKTFSHKRIFKVYGIGGP